MTTTFCDSTDVKLKAGAQVSTAITDAQYTAMINDAENFINNAVRIDLLAGYSGYSNNAKLLLRDTAAAKAAMTAIAYDQSGYFVSEAQTLLNVNYTILSDNMRLLTKKDTTDWMTKLT